MGRGMIRKGIMNGRSMIGGMMRGGPPQAAGVLHCMDILLSPAMAAVLMSLSTVIVAINSKLLQVSK